MEVSIFIYKNEYNNNNINNKYNSQIEDILNFIKI